jgi:hypothetical protein
MLRLIVPVCASAILFFDGSAARAQAPVALTTDIPLSTEFLSTSILAHRPQAPRRPGPSTLRWIGRTAVRITAIFVSIGCSLSSPLQ